MPDYAIVTDELRRLTVRVIPVALVIFGLLVLLGKPLGQVALGAVSYTHLIILTQHFIGIGQRKCAVANGIHPNACLLYTSRCV